MLAVFFCYPHLESALYTFSFFYVGFKLINSSSVKLKRNLIFRRREGTIIKKMNKFLSSQMTIFSMPMSFSLFVWVNEEIQRNTVLMLLREARQVHFTNSFLLYSVYI
jgi:hypothetical protein